MAKECRDAEQAQLFLNESGVIACDTFSFSEHELEVSSDEQWCRFIRDRRWGAPQKRRLLVHFGSVAKVLNANVSDVNRVIRNRSKQLKSNISIEEIESDLNWLALPNNHLIGLDDERYPSLLKHLPDPPLALFASGNVDLLNKPQVAIVGSRRPTPIGEKIVADIGTELANWGIVITSGLALGVDGMAHQAALGVDGETIAVMGCGLDVIYPVRNRALFEQVQQKGLMLSEFPLGVAPSKYTFPMRNRIVSGLSLGVLIVEAAEKSGTLITANFANEQNKEVMVVPGSSVSRQYQGSHALIKEGAALVTSAFDVLHCLELPLSRELEKQGLSAEVDAPSRLLLDIISAESTSIDSIISSSGLTTAEVSSILLELELDGLVAVSHDGGYINLS